MSLDKTIVIDNGGRLDFVIKLLTDNWRQMAEAGHKIAVRIYEHKEKRTLEQQALMWIRLGEIARQAWVRDEDSGELRLYSAEVWHEKMKMDYLPEEVGPTLRCRKGYRKWMLLPGGGRVMAGSTTQLTVTGMAEYLTQIMAYGASEHAVHFSATPSELAGYHTEDAPGH